MPLLRTRECDHKISMIEGFIPMMLLAGINSWMLRKNKQLPVHRRGIHACSDCNHILLLKPVIRVSKGGNKQERRDLLYTNPYLDECIATWSPFIDTKIKVSGVSTFIINSLLPIVSVSNRISHVFGTRTSGMGS